MSAATVQALTGEIRASELALLAKALGHPARVRILRLLLSHEHCYCGEIVEELPLAQATVSQHLKVLKEAGLIVGEVEGLRTCYWGVGSGSGSCTTSSAVLSTTPWRWIRVSAVETLKAPPPHSAPPTSSS